MTPGRVRTRAAFAALAASPARARRGFVRVAHVPVEGSTRAAVAFAIGRHVGGAVVRNRIRRRLRAVFAELAPAPGDYLVAVAPPAATASYASLRAEVVSALTALDVLAEGVLS